MPAPATLTGCRRIPAPAGSRWPDVVGFRRQLDSDDRLLPNSSNQISNMRAKMKCLISENNLCKSFSKIKEVFTVKLKINFVDHYFRPYQIP
jgi:pyocin large subunit-like protein